MSDVQMFNALLAAYDQTKLEEVFPYLYNFLDGYYIPLVHPRAKWGPSVFKEIEHMTAYDNWLESTHPDYSPAPYVLDQTEWNEDFEVEYKPWVKDEPRRVKGVSDLQTEKTKDSEEVASVIWEDANKILRPDEVTRTSVWASLYSDWYWASYADSKMNRAHAMPKITKALQVLSPLAVLDPERIPQVFDASSLKVLLRKPHILHLADDFSNEVWKQIDILHTMLVQALQHTLPSTPSHLILKEAYEYLLNKVRGLSTAPLCNPVISKILNATNTNTEKEKETVTVNKDYMPEPLIQQNPNEIQLADGQVIQINGKAYVIKDGVPVPTILPGTVMQAAQMVPYLKVGDKVSVTYVVEQVEPGAVLCSTDNSVTKTRLTVEMLRYEV